MSPALHRIQSSSMMDFILDQPWDMGMEHCSWAEHYPIKDTLYENTAGE